MADSARVICVLLAAVFMVGGGIEVTRYAIATLPIVGNGDIVPPLFFAFGCFLVATVLIVIAARIDDWPHMRPPRPPMRP